jgi:fatty acid desaturase
MLAYQPHVTSTLTSGKNINVSSYLRHKKPLWNLFSFVYVLSAYAGGIALLLLSNGWLNVLGTALLSHSLILSAYIAHEFMHGTIFAERKWNAVGGNIALWLNGGCYARFKDLARDHIAHHVNRVDFSAFNLPAFINSLPSPLRHLILVLEWLYFPVISLLLQWRAITAPFSNYQRRDERLRVTLILAVRGLLFSLLGLVSLKSLALYFVAYISMITVLRFMDAFQHTYGVFPVGTPLPKLDYTYEQANTYTTLMSQRYWWLNLLLLNFGYHNAHHEVMKCPWYSLHELDKELSEKQKVHRLTLPQLLVNYHYFRMERIFNGQGQATDEQGNLQLDAFYGAIGVSMLVKF